MMMPDLNFSPPQEDDDEYLKITDKKLIMVRKNMCNITQLLKFKTLPLFGYAFQYAI
jgi:hypothetical protein